MDCYNLRSVAVCFYWRKLSSSVQLNIHYVAESCAVESMYMDALEPFISVLIIKLSLHAKAPFVTITKCVYVDYAGVLIFKSTH